MNTGRNTIAIDIDEPGDLRRFFAADRQTATRSLLLEIGIETRLLDYNAE